MQIAGSNISPFCRESSGLKAQLASHWRDDLRQALEGASTAFLEEKGVSREVTCSFPHDPSVPTDPFPRATLIVENFPELFDSENTSGFRNVFARVLGQVFERFLNKHRDSTDATVEVIVRCLTPVRTGYYRTARGESAVEEKNDG